MRVCAGSGRGAAPIGPECRVIPTTPCANSAHSHLCYTLTDSFEDKARLPLPGRRTGNSSSREVCIGIRLRILKFFVLCCSSCWGAEAHCRLLECWPCPSIFVILKCNLINMYNQTRKQHKSRLQSKACVTAPTCSRCNGPNALL